MTSNRDRSRQCRTVEQRAGWATCRRRHLRTETFIHTHKAVMRSVTSDVGLRHSSENLNHIITADMIMSVKRRAYGDVRSVVHQPAHEMILRARNKQPPLIVSEPMVAQEQLSSRSPICGAFERQCIVDPTTSYLRSERSSKIHAQLKLLVESLSSLQLAESSVPTCLSVVWKQSRALAIPKVQNMHKNSRNQWSQAHNKTSDIENLAIGKQQEYDLYSVLGGHHRSI
ncbi:hypothetical protein BJ508DRAFT_305180 [Ascobolus immersus RN42]|uniref:Uncharacterized protein n=1 Tax=Ascobolus immersus RN42 TaxID=1160509 RepID=A0A3N4I9Y5_ASCIM|nr:hypothetical protein BJ508DRAFT_305180 [Ascobolus immersus RN42]